ncbi:MAG: hypothetical protein IT200_12795 [Thermoleophilia bacterium]|nr:hypothetical protein [Thermoleophilia bacterium]
MTARARGAAAARPRPRTREEAPRPRPRQVPAPRAAARRRPVARPRGIALWIPAVAILLGGIVWVNVARLQLTDQTSRVIERSSAVRSEMLRLEAKFNQQNASVQEQARTRLRMDQPASDGDVKFLSVPSIPTR